MNINFTPDEKQSEKIEVPFIEDARSNFAPFYATTKNIKQAKAEVEREMAKLGAAVERFQSGKFDVNARQRHGYLITFNWSGAQGQIRVAGLPIRTYSSKKETQVRVQALLNVAAWLKTLVTQQVFSPGSNPLVPYLLTPGGKTIMEHILESGSVPMLNAPEETIIDGELVEES